MVKPYLLILTILLFFPYSTVKGSSQITGNVIESNLEGEMERLYQGDTDYLTNWENFPVNFWVYYNSTVYVPYSIDLTFSFINDYEEQPPVRFYYNQSPSMSIGIYSARPQTHWYVYQDNLSANVQRGMLGAFISFDGKIRLEEMDRICGLNPHYSYLTVNMTYTIMGKYFTTCKTQDTSSKLIAKQSHLFPFISCNEDLNLPTNKLFKNIINSTSTGTSTGNISSDSSNVSWYTLGILLTLIFTTIRKRKRL
ncbi:MAG: hypothetical protein ACXAC7_14640 [Candidatus Hodarchaeales archaeon]|jgi:hypothetical protein